MQGCRFRQRQVRWCRSRRRGGSARNSAGAWAQTLVSGSVWSTINIKKVAELEKAGRMRQAGRDAFADKLAGIYSYENRPSALPPAYERCSIETAWLAKTSMDAHRRTSEPPSGGVISAKQESTRVRRMTFLVECHSRGDIFPAFDRGVVDARAEREALERGAS